jgi:hypothetical protein
MSELEDKRRSLHKIYEKLGRLEHDDENAELVRQYRARARQLAHEIAELDRAQG